MRIDKRFTNKFQKLVEYNINNYQKEPLYSNDKSIIVQEEDPTPLPVDNMASAPVETTPTVGDNDVTDKLSQKTDILKELGKNHTDKIDDILKSMENLDKDILELKQKSQDIDELKNNIGLLKKQVDFLTPPTPEESLEKMVKISGGQTIDDYWKEYLAKQGKTLNGKLPYYQNGNLSNNKAEIVDMKFTDDEIKKSLGLGYF
jgi:hypothetical protein